MDSWLSDGRYLPTFMRDFHDQKDLFRYLDGIRERSDANAQGAPAMAGVDSRAAHVYTVNVFLWVMAKNGWTLQRARKRFSFGDICESVAASTREHLEQCASILSGVLRAARSAKTTSSGTSEASGS
jgi:hypothetical protein